MTIDAHGWGLLGLCVAVIINPLLLIYVVKFKLDDIEAYLSRSKMIADSVANWAGAGVIGRVGRLMTVYICLLVPGYWSKRGLVVREDVKSLPISLTLWVLVPGSSAFAILLALYVYP